jgi:hypothetical protein
MLRHTTNLSLPLDYSGLTKPTASRGFTTIPIHNFTISQ